MNSTFKTKMRNKQNQQSWDILKKPKNMLRERNCSKRERIKICLQTLILSFNKWRSKIVKASHSQLA